MYCRRYPTLQIVPTKSDYLGEIGKLESEIDCCGVCHRVIGCHTWTYEHSSFKCTLHGVLDSGFQYFESAHHTSGELGKHA